MTDTATTTDPTTDADWPALRPLEDRVIIRLDEPETVTTFGLHLPDNAQAKPNQGVVLAVGPGRRNTDTGERVPMTLAVGDHVLVSKYGGTTATVDGVELLLILEPEVLAIVEPD